MIVVDSREPKTIQHLLSRMGVEYKVDSIPFDCIVSGLKGVLIVERKTVTDIVNSIKSGRIFTQLAQMHDATDDNTRALLSVIGDFRKIFYATKFRISSFYSALSACVFGFDVSVLHFSSNLRYCEFIASVSKYLESEREPRVPVFKPKARTTREEAMRIVASLPGVSTKLAERILQHFGTVRSVFNNIDRIDEVRGIGSSVKLKIIKAVDYDWNAA